jgi:stearoyl-CoA desaturase (Delta-9 desaturase)
MTIFDSVLNLLAHGVTDAAWWQVTLYTLVVTHLTIVSVTVFLHRHQAHRALDLHAIPSHFFRFWLWLTTGMETKEFVAVHRKHHAKCETAEDPHSPQIRGIDTLLLRGTELYRAEARNTETLSRYGHGTPDDWIERYVYTLNSRKGVVLMMLINLFLFGGIGATVWAIQMAWIPVMATGIINGIGHYWGYRNFEVADASTNVSPWGILIGGEELHNNHHTYATSARFSVKPYEFDIGWFYISMMEKIGWAKAKKTPPKMQLGDVRPVADEKTLEALIANRYEVMASYARGVRTACKTEIATLKAKGEAAGTRLSALKSAKRWLPRDADKVPAAAAPQLAQARAEHPVLDKMIVMREELRQLWTSTNVSREQLTHDLAAWCKRAEDSGIAALQEFSMRLRAVRA